MAPGQALAILREHRRTTLVATMRLWLTELELDSLRAMAASEPGPETEQARGAVLLLQRMVDDLDPPPVAEPRDDDAETDDGDGALDA